jgi:hypothetical protein
MASEENGGGHLQLADAARCASAFGLSADWGCGGMALRME